MVRVWKYLVPGSGEHTLEVRNIGSRKQTVSLDGERLESQDGQIVFVAADRTVLRLKQDCKLSSLLPSARQGKWTLLVNEQPMEELSCASRNGLRSSQHLPDGSYTIATGFSSVGITKHACRKFRFEAAGRLHEVVVAHQASERLWLISLDDELVDQERHGILEMTGNTDFDVPVASGERLRACLRMFWSLTEFRWCCSLTVGSVAVPPSWSRGRGRMRKVKAPEVVADYAASNSAIISSSPSGDDKHHTHDEDRAEDSDDDDDNVDDNGSIPLPDILPQGVSFDREAGVFQATIKDPNTNRFLFLGEFATAEDAHCKYVEACQR